MKTIEELREEFFKASDELFKARIKHQQKRITLTKKLKKFKNKEFVYIKDKRQIASWNRNLPTRIYCAAPVKEDGKTIEYYVQVKYNGHWKDLQGTILESNLRRAKSKK